MAIKNKRTKQWIERINGSKNMLWLLGTLSFLETIILPIPIELVLIPLMAANKQRIWLLATVTTAGCLVASLVGYGVGMLLFQSIGTWFLEFMGMQNSYQAFQTFYCHPLYRDSAYPVSSRDDYCGALRLPCFALRASSVNCSRCTLFWSCLARSPLRPSCIGAMETTRTSHQLGSGDGRVSAGAGNAGLGGVDYLISAIAMRKAGVQAYMP